MASEVTIRPMTDEVEVSVPGTSTFNITATYYINQSDKAAAATIQAEVDKAVQDYITWQTTEIGRDINPDELILASLRFFQSLRFMKAEKPSGKRQSRAPSVCVQVFYSLRI